MSEVSTEQGEVVDGRRARREKNQNAVLDAVLEMFAEESLIPSIEDASRRSGLSLRSLYRYFSDPDELIEAAIVRHRERTVDLVHIPDIGEGPLDKRIDDLVDMRLRVYERVAPTFRATVHNAPRNVRMREELESTRRRLRDQFERQFAPELKRLGKAERVLVIAAGDVLSQFDTIDLLRRSRRLSVAATRDVVRHGLTALFRSSS